MQNIYTGSSFNAYNTFVPGTYLQVIPPQSYFTGVPTTVVAAVGTAPWGAKNVAQLMSNPGQMVNFYGGINAAAVNDVHDLCTDVTLALSQAQGQAALQIYGIRVTDGTDTAATTFMYSGTSQTVTIAGTATTGDVINILFINSAFTGGSYNFQHAVTSGETTVTLIASDIVTAITANTTLSTAGFTATSSSGVITISWTATNAVTIQANANGTNTLTVGGTITSTDVLTLNVLDAGLPAGSLQLQYVVPVGASTTTIATAFAALINANQTLAGLGITATSSSAVVSLVSTSVNKTTYTKSVSTGATETLTLAAGAGETVTVGSGTLGATVAAIYTGAMANSSPTNTAGIVLLVTAGFAANTVNVTVVPFAGGGTPELFTGLPSSGNLFWSAFAAAVNSGTGRIQGPSQWIRVSSNQPTTAGPQTGTYYFGGGTSGRNVTSANLIGADSPTLTGMYCLERTQFQPSVMWIAGLTDSTTWATVQSFCQQNNIFGLLTFAAGTSTATAVSTKATSGIASYSMGFVKDWIYFFDSTNNTTQLVAPMCVAGGLIGTLIPQISPCNQAVYSIVGTERNNPVTGTTPYGYAELNQLGQAGIMLLTNPIDQGNVFGFENGYNSVGNGGVTSVVEYSRMTNYLIATNANVTGPFIGKNQSNQSGDPFKAGLRTALNTAFQTLQDNFVIDGYSVLCSSQNNPQSTVAQHICVVQEQITYLASVLFINVQLQGGTTVVTATNQLGQLLFQSPTGNG